MVSISGIHEAAWQLRPKLIQTHLNQDCDINSQDKFGDTPLMKAIASTHADENTCKITLGYNHMFSDHAPTSQRHSVESEATALESFMFVEDMCSRKPCEKYLTVQYLLKHKADPNIMNVAEETPLYCAVSNRRCSLELIQLLLSFGADPTISSKCGDNPLNIAKRQKRQTLIKLLGDENNRPSTFFERLNRYDSPFSSMASIQRTLSRTDSDLYFPSIKNSTSEKPKLKNCRTLSSECVPSPECKNSLSKVLNRLRSRSDLQSSLTMSLSTQYLDEKDHRQQEDPGNPVRVINIPAKKSKLLKSRSVSESPSLFREHRYSP